MFLSLLCICLRWKIRNPSSFRQNTYLVYLNKSKDHALLLVDEMYIYLSVLKVCQVRTKVHNLWRAGFAHNRCAFSLRHMTKRQTCSPSPNPLPINRYGVHMYAPLFNVKILGYDDNTKPGILTHFFSIDFGVE